jgi:hypothetical protein
MGYITRAEFDADPAPEHWRCADCNVNTAPNAPTSAELKAAFDAGAERVNFADFDSRCEVFTVRDPVWRAARMRGGCLCVGCLEKRIGRQLRPKDFDRNHAFNSPNMPGTARLLQRRGLTQEQQLEATLTRAIRSA